MKIRNGFVSNSSSSSFLIYGISFENEQDLINKAIEFCIDKIGEDAIKRGIDIKEFEFDSYDAFDYLKNKFEFLENYEFYSIEEYYFYIGKSWNRIKNDQTGYEFKMQIETELQEIFGEDCEIGTYQEAWNN